MRLSIYLLLEVPTLKVLHKLSYLHLARMMQAKQAQRMWLDKALRQGCSFLDNNDQMQTRLMGIKMK
jgi:hypothetical protein